MAKLLPNTLYYNTNPAEIDRLLDGRINTVRHMRSRVSRRSHDREDRFETQAGYTFVLQYRGNAILRARKERTQSRAA